MEKTYTKHIVLKAIFFVAVLIITGCASSSYYGSGQNSQPPIPSTMTKDGITVKVTPNYWPYTPQNLPDYAVPYLIEIDNQSAKTIDVFYEDVILFDPFRTQYNPLSPEVVASAISTSEPTYGYTQPAYPRVSLGVGFGFGGGYGRGYGRRGYYGPAVGIYNYYPGWYAPPVAYQTEPVSTKDVLTFALVSGPVYPGAKVSGFVYFRNPPNEVPQVTLDVGWRDPNKPDTPEVLSFPFTLGLYPEP